MEEAGTSAQPGPCLSSESLLNVLGLWLFPVLGLSGTFQIQNSKPAFNHPQPHTGCQKTAINQHIHIQAKHFATETRSLSRKLTTYNTASFSQADILQEPTQGKFQPAR